MNDGMKGASVFVLNPRFSNNYHGKMKWMSYEWNERVFGLFYSHFSNTCGWFPSGFPFPDPVLFFILL